MSCGRSSLFSPSGDDLTDFGETAEQLQIEHLVSKAPIETFNESILVQFAGFNQKIDFLSSSNIFIVLFSL